MSKIILSTLCLFLSLAMFAQEEESKEPKNNRHAIGIGIGTGLTFDYSYKINEMFYATARYNFFKYGVTDLEQEIDGEIFLVDAAVDFKGFDIAVSIHPFKSAFKIVAGYGSFQYSNLQVDAVFAESIFIGDVEFTTDDIGIISITSAWNKQAPYLGIGFGRAVPKNRRLGFGIEIGTYFAGSPDISLQASGILENTTSQEDLLQEAFNELKYLPYLQLRVSYAIF
ncbi:hypothetical protein [Flavicella sp.]|uniref:hypothetical protein n=1 Tax=Flavicella sp. TaxID=2957742 RepID=UPI00301A0529